MPLSGEPGSTRNSQVGRHGYPSTRHALSDHDTLVRHSNLLLLGGVAPLGDGPLTNLPDLSDSHLFDIYSNQAIIRS